MDRYFRIMAVVDGQLVPSFIIDRHAMGGTVGEIAKSVEDIVNPRGLFTVDAVHMVPVDDMVTKLLKMDDKKGPRIGLTDDGDRRRVSKVSKCLVCGNIHPDAII